MARKASTPKGPTPVETITHGDKRANIPTADAHDFVDPQIETALLSGRRSPDPATRIKAYQTVNERLAQDLPYIWLGQTVWSAVGDTRIQNFANPILPDGSPGQPFDNGIFFPTQIWMAG